MVDLFFVLGFCSVSLFCLDQLGLWEVILKHLGTGLFTHHFWATYIIINAVFYSFALFLAYFDLKNTSVKVILKLIYSYLHRWNDLKSNHAAKRLKRLKTESKILARNPIIGKVLRISEPKVTVNEITFKRSFECARYFAFPR